MMNINNAASGPRTSNAITPSSVIPGQVNEKSAPLLPTALKSHLPHPLRGAVIFIRGLFGSIFNRITNDYKPRDAVSPGDRAQESWAATQAHLGLAPNAGIYSESNGSLITTTVWPYGQAIAAALDLSRLDGNNDRLAPLFKGLSNFDKGGAYAPGPWGGNRLWDDNAWVGLDLIQAYNQTKEPAYLAQAEALFPFFVQGLHKDGGLYWEENNPRMTRNACANGPAEEYALRLYMLTKKPQYLAYAKNLDNFLTTKLRSPEGLYYDNIGDDGKLNKAIYSYNQGVAIGADVLWYKLTGEQKYLDRATQTAHAALNHFGQSDKFWKSSPAFNAIFFRNLLALDAVAPDPAYKARFNAYLDRAWKEARNPETGLFTEGGVGHYSNKPAGLLDQSGWVQMYALAADPTRAIDQVS